MEHDFGEKEPVQARNLRKVDAGGLATQNHMGHPIRSTSRCLGGLLSLAEMSMASTEFVVDIRIQLVRSE